MERGIIFSDSMVRAIESECNRPGTGKTMTRRLICGWARYLRDRPPSYLPTKALVEKSQRGRSDFRHVTPGLYSWRSDPLNHQIGRPLWIAEVNVRPGDVLWVKEAWALDQDGAPLWRASPTGSLPFSPDAAPRWKNPMFMPRWHSRFRIEVTDVRIEPVQDIGPGDAVREGVGSVAEFQVLWGNLHGGRGANSWAANPLVIVIEFKPTHARADPACQTDPCKANVQNPQT